MHRSKLGNQLERPWVRHAGGEPIGDAKALLDLAQNQMGDRPGSGNIGSVIAPRVASRKWRKLETLEWSAPQK
jgi:hypothetical protein